MKGVNIIVWLIAYSFLPCKLSVKALYTLNLQLSGEVTEMAVSGSLSPSLLLVLVEMYALCVSRHPLQRAISR